MATFIICFKTPDAVDQAHLECLPSTQEESKAIQDVIAKFIEYNEYVIIEFDSEAQTAKVVPVK